MHIRQSGQPDCAVVTACGEDGLARVNSQRPQLALCVTLNQTARLLFLSQRDLEHFTVLCSRQHLVASPTHAANAQACRRMCKPQRNRISTTSPIQNALSTVVSIMQQYSTQFLEAGETIRVLHKKLRIMVDVKIFRF